jgi:hypothetical protein
MFSLTHRIVSKRRPLILLSLTALLLFHLWNVTHQPEDDGQFQHSLKGNNGIWQKTSPSSGLDQYKTPNRPLPDADLESFIVGHDNKQPEAQQGNDIDTSTSSNTQQQQQPFHSRLPRIQFEFGQEPEAYTVIREHRQQAIKGAFMHGWNGYSKNHFRYVQVETDTNRTPLQKPMRWVMMN